MTFALLMLAVCAAGWSTSGFLPVLHLAPLLIPSAITSEIPSVAAAQEQVAISHEPVAIWKPIGGP
jgi:hypothetical protein